MVDEAMTSTRSAPPKYLTIRNDLRRKILDGKLAPGSRLSSQIKLAETYGVSLLTARQALGRLQDEGLIEQRHGHGTFVTKRANGARRHSRSNSVGLLVVDENGLLTKTNYYMILIRELGRTLADKGYDLKFATVEDNGLAHREPHSMLDRRRVRAIVLDGFVSQFHVDFVRNLGLEVLLTGNHHVHPEVPKVCQNVRQAACAMTRAYSD